jgi:TRAP-type C4-dicarboxylate transport system permease small subunit
MEEKKKKFSIEGYIAAILLFTLTVLLAIQVFVRFVFGGGIAWSEELSRYMFVWSIYFGCIVAAKEDKHIRVTAQLMFLSERKKAWLISASDIIWIIFNGLLAYFGFTYILSMFEFPFYSQTMGFNLAWVYAIVPLAYFLMLVYVALLIVKRVRDLLKSRNVNIVDSRLNM